MLYQRSSQLFVEANEVIPGGVNSPVRAFKGVGGFPIFIKDESGVKIYGKDASGNVEQKTSGVTCNYIKQPVVVSWAYNSVTGTYDASNSTNFELHPSEETELIIKILALAGIILKDNSLYGIASGEDVKNTQQEKS